MHRVGFSEVLAKHDTLASWVLLQVGSLMEDVAQVLLPDEDPPLNLL